MSKKDKLAKLPPLPNILEVEKAEDKTIKGGKGEDKKEASKYSTVAIRTDILDKIKAFAYWERITQKELINEIMEDFFSRHDPKPIPKKKSRKLI